MSYTFINSLFTSILQQSATIQGRFFISSKQGNEINSDVLGQVLTDATTQVQVQKYPLALMLAPNSRGELNTAINWQDYTITMFFLRPTYYDAFNQIADINYNTQTSMRPVVQDWEAMEACANDFVRVLDMMQRRNAGLFRLKKEFKAIMPVSTVGIDRVSGVRLDFAISLFGECVVSDYDTNTINIDLPLNN